MNRFIKREIGIMSYVMAYSNCEEREASENYKMKNSYPTQWDCQNAYGMWFLSGDTVFGFLFCISLYICLYGSYMVQLGLLL